MRLLVGDCRDRLKELPDASVDSVVCDPPYELGFMGKAWDSTGVAYDEAVWGECLRVLKPGGHLLAFGGSRTYHRLACAVEDAGFEIRDQIMWVYGSGFPKSLNVSKAIDKAAGVEFRAEPASGVGFMNSNNDGYNMTLNKLSRVGDTTAEAAAWDGWGTALKPAHEPIVMARKPLVGTVAANVLDYGTGAINIDGCRIPGALEGDPNRFTKTDGGSFNSFSKSPPVVRSEGRWPANFIHDGSDEVLGLLSEAARFFYCAKPGKKERNAGLEHLDDTLGGSLEGGNDKRNGDTPQLKPTKNHHPTVKPLTLMRYLVRMVTPPGGTVLDPFTGSGTTLMAAVMEGMTPMGCEMTEDYVPIIEGRVAWAEQQRKMVC